MAAKFLSLTSRLKNGDAIAENTTENVEKSAIEGKLLSLTSRLKNGDAIAENKASPKLPSNTLKGKIDCKEAGDEAEDISKVPKFNINRESRGNPFGEKPDAKPKLLSITLKEKIEAGERAEDISKVPEFNINSESKGNPFGEKPDAIKDLNSQGAIKQYSKSNQSAETLGGKLNIEA